jgi:pyruvate ferredoxin oxidoreductase alpha subunit
MSVKKVPKAVLCSYAIADAVMKCKPEVIASYPITPQTLIVENLAELKSSHRFDGEFINVESEHSAISACIGAQANGSRTFTATSSQGLALMHEMLFIASGMRLPIVMAVANRSLSAPINIWGDHSDGMAQRDSGWIQLYCESVQEAHDTIVQAYRIAENKDIMLPVMVCIDGFTLSHVSENAELLNEDDVRKFLPPYKPIYKLDINKPMTFGSISYPNTYTEFKQQQQKAMEHAVDVIKKTNSEFSQKFGRKYGDGLIEIYNLDKAEQVIVALGSQCSTIRHVIDNLVKSGKRVGLIRIKSFRPFPSSEIIGACKRKNVERIDVIDRAVSLGNLAPLYSECVSAINNPKIKINSHVLGLGGEDITPEKIKDILK